MKLVPYTAEFLGGLDNGAAVQGWLQEPTPAGYADPLKVVGQIGVLEAVSPADASELLMATGVQLQASEIPVSRTLRGALGLPIIEALEREGAPLTVEAGWRAWAEWFQIRQTPLGAGRARGLLSTVVQTNVVAEACGKSTDHVASARLQMGRMLAHDHHVLTQQIPEALARLEQLRSTLAGPTSKRSEHLKWALKILLPNASPFIGRVTPEQGEAIIRAHGRRHVGWLRTWILGEGHDPVVGILCLEQACRGHHMPAVGEVLKRDPVRLKQRMKGLLGFLRASTTPDDTERTLQFIQTANSKAATEFELGSPHLFTKEELGQAIEQVRLAGNLFGYRGGPGGPVLPRAAGSAVTRTAPRKPKEAGGPHRELPETQAALSVMSLGARAGLLPSDSRALSRYTLHAFSAKAGDLDDTVSDALLTLQEAVERLLPELSPPHRAVMDRFFGTEEPSLEKGQALQNLDGNFSYEQLREAADSLASLLGRGN